MKKIVSIAIAALLALALLAGCGSKENTNTTTGNNAQTSGEAVSDKVSGTVSTDGSTSMENVIGALGEAFTANNPDAKFTYNPTGSGTGITAVSEGRCDIGLSSRALKDEEKASGLTETVAALDHTCNCKQKCAREHRIGKDIDRNVRDEPPALQSRHQ